MKAKIRTLRSDRAPETPQWELGYLDVAKKEAEKLLTEEQYAHAVQQFGEIAYESDPTNSETHDVRKIDQFYELRDKGGILGRINLRVYFAMFSERKLILVLKTYKKEDEGQTPPYIVIGVRNRLREATKQMA